MFLKVKITDKIIEAALWFIAFVDMFASFMCMLFGGYSLWVYFNDSSHSGKEYIYLLPTGIYFLVSVVFYFFQDKISVKILYSYAIVNIVIIALSIWFMQDL